MGAETRYKLYL